MKGSFHIEKEHVADSIIDKTPTSSFISSGKSVWLSSSNASYVHKSSYISIYKDMYILNNLYFQCYYY